MRVAEVEEVPEGPPPGGDKKAEEVGETVTDPEGEAVSLSGVAAVRVRAGETLELDVALGEGV